MYMYIPSPPFVFTLCFLYPLITNFRSFFSFLFSLLTVVPRSDKINWRLSHSTAVNLKLSALNIYISRRGSGFQGRHSGSSRVPSPPIESVFDYPDSSTISHLRLTSTHYSSISETWLSIRQTSILHRFPKSPLLDSLYQMTNNSSSNSSNRIFHYQRSPWWWWWHDERSTTLHRTCHPR